MNKVMLACGLVLGLGAAAAIGTAGTVEAKPKKGGGSPFPSSGNNCDRDGDGVRSISCGGADCNDNDANAYPGNVEVCDAQGHDEDCNPSTFGTRDADGDKYVSDACCNRDRSGKMRCGTDCDDSKGGVHPHQNEVCNGHDDNCNGSIDEGVRMRVYPDADHDRYGDQGHTSQTLMCAHDLGNDWVGNNLDCDDSAPRKNPMLGCEKKKKKKKKKKGKK
jgi:hypothetical protein